MIWKCVIAFWIFATIWCFGLMMMVSCHAKHILEIKGYGYLNVSFIGLVLSFIVCSIPILNIFLILGVIFNLEKIVDNIVESEIKNYEQ